MKKVFIYRIVCHNNPLMVPTLSFLPRKINVEARIF